MSIGSSFSLESMNFRYGYVSDNAKLMNSDDYTHVNNIIEELQNKTTSQIAVVTVNSLEGKSVEDTAVEIGRRYKVGAIDKNNGIVILVAPNERTARIEVGQGLKNILTNSVADSIMNNDMVPYFSKGEYSKGIYRGVTSVSTIIADSYNIHLESTSSAPPRTTSQSKNDIPFWALPFVILFALFRKGNKFGGGGGFSGGRGATGRW